MPAASAPPPGTALGLTRILSAYTDGRSETSLDPDLRVFVSDLVRPYGLPLREDLLREGAGHSYAELAEGLLREAVADGRPVDLLILAFDSPDVRPGAPGSLALSRSCPGAPLAFAVCDQGTAGAFGALRIAAAHHRTGGCRRAVVVLAEQTALHYRAAAPVELPRRHCAVVLVCDEIDGTGDARAGGTGAGGLRITQQPCAESAPAVEAVRGRLRSAGAGAALLLDAGLAGEPALGDAATAVAPDGQPFTGLWTELARALPAWQARRRPVVAAGLDRRLGVLSTLTLGAAP
ncbi:hypothetical protein RMN57_34585 [Kitasatospora sp. CM 4170]|uniref:Uncharacterized protein n=1 Tax=Kitasatospora aburaviensis TaxID=67265 RepID=A0ABW1F1A2_9ACTN|nr:hypothetical protein [Kitasatospora sp. CM 4170]WNM49460.1 hypothetical protein RMN57_34585 [Kitasatospora sp. CM 4170]